MNFDDRLLGLKKVAILGVCLLPMAAACGDTAPYVEDTESESAVSLSDPQLDVNSEEQSADRVALYGQFQEHLGGTLFVLNTDGGATSEAEAASVLVVNDSDRTFAVPTDGGTPLWAFGEVRSLDLTEIDGIEPENLAAYEGESAVYAERITLAPEPSELTENAESFYNQNVTIYGEAEGVGAENTFILEDPELFGGRGVIVIQTGDTTDEIIADDTKLAVSGVLRSYVVADLQEDYGLTWDTNVVEELTADYEEVPVIIADLITLTNDE